MNNINNIVEIIAKWLECLGFIFTVVTLFKVFFLDRRVKELQTKHLFQVRIDEHLTELKTTSRKIANLLNNFSQNIKDIRIEVNKCHINCLSIKKKINERNIISLTTLIKISNSIIKNKLEIDKKPNWWNRIIGQKPLVGNNIDEFYETLSSLIKEIEHLNKDINKSIR